MASLFAGKFYRGFTVGAFSPNIGFPCAEHFSPEIPKSRELLFQFPILDIFLLPLIYIPRKHTEKNNEKEGEFQNIAYEIRKSPDGFRHYHSDKHKHYITNQQKFI